MTAFQRLAFALVILFAAARLCAQETVKVALNIPLSGPFANIGDLYVKHSQFAIDAINARGGVLGGRKLELVALDNKNSPQEAPLVMRSTESR